MKRIFSLMLILSLLLNICNIIAFADDSKEELPFVEIILTEKGEKLPDDFIIIKGENGLEIKKSDINEDGTLKAKVAKKYAQEIKAKLESNESSAKSRAAYKSASVVKFTDTPRFKQARYYYYMSPYRASIYSDGYVAYANSLPGLGWSLITTAGGFYIASSSPPGILIGLAGIYNAMLSQAALNKAVEIDNIANAGNSVLVYIIEAEYFHQTTISQWNGSTIDLSLGNTFEYIESEEYFTD